MKPRPPPLLPCKTCGVLDPDHDSLGFACLIASTAAKLETFIPYTYVPYVPLQFSSPLIQEEEYKIEMRTRFSTVSISSKLYGMLDLD